MNDLTTIEQRKKLAEVMSPLILEALSDEEVLAIDDEKIATKKRRLDFDRVILSKMETPEGREELKKMMNFAMNHSKWVNKMNLMK